jgi:hypothetical protein
MTSSDEQAAFDREVRTLAQFAFQAAMNGSADMAYQRLVQIGAKFGGEGVGKAVLIWCDQVVNRSPKPQEIDGVLHVASPVFEDLDGKERAVDDTTPQQAWAARMVATRANNDQAGMDALILSMPGTPDDCLLQLLFVCARSVRLLMGLDADARVFVDDGPEEDE